MADAGKKAPIAGKDMNSVIAQFQQVNKGNLNLRPSAGNKPKPPTAQKHSLNEQTDSGNDRGKIPRNPTSDKQGGSGSPAPSEAANPFKVALKPVNRPSGAGVTTRNFVNQKSTTEIEKPVTMNNDEAPETTPKVSSSIVNKSKMFETQQTQLEGDTPNKPTVGVGGAATKPKLPGNSNHPKSPGVHNPQTKPAPAVDSAPKVNGTSGPSANKWNTVESKPQESKEAGQKLDGKKEIPLRKGIQDKAEADDKVGNTNFATMRPVISTGKPSLPATSNTLPKQPKPAVSTITKATTESDPEMEYDNQPKIPPKPSDKAEQAKIHAKTTEDIDQPKIPPRREQKSEERAADKKNAPKQQPTANRKAEESKNDRNAQKAGGLIGETLLRNIGRPLPKPAEKQYRLLPVPKQKGKPPRKMAKPPTVDLSKYASYDTSKSVQLTASQVSEDSYEDGDDLYEDCDNMEVVTKQSSRISEYTEEEEAKMEKSSKVKPNTTNTDNYGKMFNAPSVDEYNDDDEIYQEID